jgi:hypothetical protein
LIVVLVGFALNGISRVVGRRNERKNIRKLFANNVENLLERVPKEKEHLKVTAASFNIENDTPAVHFLAGMYQLDVFRDMTYKRVFEAYFTGMENNFRFTKGHRIRESKLLNFNKAWTIINRLEALSKLLEERRQSYNEENNGYRNKYNDALNELRKAWASIPLYFLRQLNSVAFEMPYSLQTSSASLPPSYCFKT